MKKPSVNEAQKLYDEMQAAAREHLSAQKAYIKASERLTAAEAAHDTATVAVSRFNAVAVNITRVKQLGA